MYGNLPGSQELGRWEEAVARHSAVPGVVENAIAALPHDAHFMGTILTAVNALSTCHPEQNPALAGQSVYKDKEIQDKQIVRLIGQPPAGRALLPVLAPCQLCLCGPFCRWKLSLDQVMKVGYMPRQEHVGQACPLSGVARFLAERKYVTVATASVVGSVIAQQAAVTQQRLLPLAAQAASSCRLCRLVQPGNCPPSVTGH